MKNLSRLVVAFGLAASLTVSTAACGHKEMWRSQTAEASGVRIVPEQVYTGGRKLWVRTTVFNGTQMPMVIIRDQIVARLPNGAVIQRAAGKTTIHAPYNVMPGGAHEVYVEFEEEGLDWATVPSVNIDFSQGVLLNGQPTQLPPLVASP
jgi:hypothetical protein